MAKQLNFYIDPEKIREVSGSLVKAFFTVTIESSIDINDMKLVERKDGGGYFVSPPSKTYKTKRGADGYANIVFFTDGSLLQSIAESIISQLGLLERGFEPADRQKSEPISQGASNDDEIPF